MEREKIDKIIESFEAVLVRPLIYFGKYDSETVINFTLGFYQALTVTNQNSPSIDDYKKISKKRNWHFNALGVVPDMREKGLAEEEIVKELLQIEIEVWKLYREELEKI